VRRLRRDEGRSIKEIAAVVGVSVSSVSLWVRDIELTSSQLADLQRRNPAFNRQLQAWRANADRARERRLRYQHAGRALARHNDAAHAAGTMLYWAEGDKGTKNTARISNSDPEVLRYFLAFLRKYFGVGDERMRVACNLFADHVERQWEIEQFWLDVLGLPRSCLRKSTVNVYSKHSQKKRRNKLPYGTCRLAVHDTSIVQSIFGSIQEYGGFERPEWLG
jgi:transcriptional regulator with XRE-family HTH domain